MPDTDVEDQVRTQLGAALGPGPAAIADWDDLETRLAPADRRRRQRRAGLLAAAVVIVSLAAVAVLARPTGVRVRTGPAAPAPRPSTPPTATRPPSVDVPPTSALASTDPKVRTIRSITMHGGGSLVATPDGVWVVTTVDRTTLVHVDRSGRQIGSVVIPNAPTSPGAGPGPVYMASGEGSIWVLVWATGTLWRVDPATAAISGHAVIVATPSAGTEPERVAAGAGHVWVTVCCDRAAPNQRVLRLDPRTLAVEATIALPGDGENEAVVAGPMGVFVTGEGFDTVAQLDPNGSRVLREISVAGGAGPVTLTDTQVFVPGGWSRQSSTATALYSTDPSTGTVYPVATWPAPVQQLAGSPSVLWALASPKISVFGPVLSLQLSDRTVAVVPDTDGAGAISASGNVLWYLRGDDLVEVQRG